MGHMAGQQSIKVRTHRGPNPKRREVTQFTNGAAPTGSEPGCNTTIALIFFSLAGTSYTIYHFFC